MAAVIKEKPSIQHRALVVDDSQIARKLLSRQLIKLGLDVEVANSAESALKQLAGSSHDIVFMDHLLPGMDGLEAVVRLRSQPRTASLPIVMYTSQESDAFADMARRAGADDVFTKTASPVELGKILRRLDVLPAWQAETTTVVPLRSELGAPSAPAGGSRKLKGADLIKLFEPSLAAHHAKLHQELLAEFAILERYEERMRHDLFARVDTLAQHATRQVDRALIEQTAENDHARSESTRRWLTMAAAIVVSLSMTVAFGWKVASRNQELVQQSSAVMAAMDAQTVAMNDLRSEMYEGLFEAVESAVHRNELQTTFAVPSEFSGDFNPRNVSTPTAAAALVSELQAMGIMGPVRIETGGGSFCVRSSSTGFRIELSNLGFDACESLPPRLAAVSW